MWGYVRARVCVKMQKAKNKRKCYASATATFWATSNHNTAAANGVVTTDVAVLSLHTSRGQGRIIRLFGLSVWTFRLFYDSMTL